MLTVKQARKAIATTADVLTPDGDAGVVDVLHTFDRHVPATREGTTLIGQCAHVAGEHVYGWYLLTELSPSQSLLNLPDTI